MSYLLDTHTLLWWLDENPTLSNQATTIISSPQNIIFVSAVSAWEISIKKAIGKLEAPDDLESAIASLMFFSSSLLNTVSSKPEPRVETIVKETKVDYSKYPKILVFMADKSNRGKGKLMAVNTKEAKIDGTWDSVSGIGGKENQPGRGPTPSNTVALLHR